LFAHASKMLYLDLVVENVFGESMDFHFASSKMPLDTNGFSWERICAKLGPESNYGKTARWGKGGSLSDKFVVLFIPQYLTLVGCCSCTALLDSRESSSHRAASYSRFTMSWYFQLSECLKMNLSRRTSSGRLGISASNVCWWLGSNIANDNNEIETDPQGPDVPSIFLRGQCAWVYGKGGPWNP
jgi:hypothetical protein